MNNDKWRYLQSQFEPSFGTSTSVVSGVGATGPAGPPGPSPAGTQYSDFLFWNTSGATWNVGSSIIHVGAHAGEHNQGFDAVAVGSKAGMANQGSEAVALGFKSGYSNQATSAVAVGSHAASNSQGRGAVAVGAQAAFTGQGDYAIALGFKAGYQHQKDRCIVLNAWDTALNGSTAGACFIRPIRNVTNSLPTNALLYDAQTFEMVYASTSLLPNSVSSAKTTQLISYTDATPTSVPRFIANGAGTSLVTVAGQQNFMHVTVQLVLDCDVANHFALTLARGTSATPSNNYTNLANNVPLVTTALAVADTLDNADALLTSMYQGKSEGTGVRTVSACFTVTDSPGSGTWYYALQLLTVPAARVAVRNSHITFMLVNV